MAKADRKVKVPRRGEPPAGYEKVQPVIEKFQAKLKALERSDAVPKTGGAKNEQFWEIYKVEHQKSRYIYSLYYQRKLISDVLYLWLVKHRIVNGELIAKWRKQGYETLCCLQCIGKTVCVCRVPKSVRNKEPDFKCVGCGCRGCASSD